MERTILSDDAIESSANMLMLLVERSKNIIFLIIPSRALWHGEDQERVKQIHAKFVDILNSRSLRVIDMKQLFEESGDPLNYYFKTDPHWIAEGHKRAAVAIFQEISRKNKRLN